MKFEYHKIPTVFLRDPDTKFRTLLEGQFATPELDYLQDNVWLFTEKIDGTNIRIMYQCGISSPGEIQFGGRTDNSQIPTHLIAALLKLFPQTKETRDLFGSVFEEARDVCLYGEGYGAKIQKGGEKYREDQGFILFDIRIGEWWLKREDVNDVAKKLGLDVVPYKGLGSLTDMIGLIKAGVRSEFGDFQAEGLVARPAICLFSRNGNRIITKLKHKDFQ